MKSYMKRAVLAILAVMIAACAPQADFSQIDAVVEEAIGEGNVPGAVVAIVHEGKTVFLKAYGNKSVVPEEVPMTTETMFDLASVSKCVGTTTAVMQLVERGKLRLSDEVRRYIPEFRPWTDPDTGEEVHITIQDLMSHTSGLSAAINVNSFVGRFGEACPDTLIRYIATEIPRHFRPRTGHIYSCINFITLQNVVQRITGEPLWQYVEDNVFAPLGMRHSCYFPLGEDLRTPVVHQELVPLVAPTTVQADGTPLVAAVHDPTARRINMGNSGNAGVFSNAEDLAVFCNSLMGYGPRVLSPASVRRMATIPPENDPSVGRALGWDKKSYATGLRGDLFDPETTIMHTGYTGTSVVIDLSSKTAVIVLAHRVHPVDDGSVARMRACIANIAAAQLLKN